MRFTNTLPAIAAWSAWSAATVNAAPVAEAELVVRQSQPCYAGVYVIQTRGTFEPQNASISNNVANAIVKQIPNSAAIQVVYPSNADPTSQFQGVIAMRKLVEDYNTACPSSKTVLLGYSQGASVLGDTIANPFSSSSINAASAKNVAAVILVSDPGRNKDQGNKSFQAKPCTASALTPRSFDSYKHMAAYNDRLIDVCHYDDPVCCSSGTDFAQHIAYFTNELADAIALYVAGKVGTS